MQGILLMFVVAFGVAVNLKCSEGAGALPPLPFFNIPYQGIRNPGACVFNGPQDSPALRGENFIENFGLNKCLVYTRSPGNQRDLQVSLENCNWERIPTSSQLYKVQNGNGGSLVKPTVSGMFGKQACLSTTSFGGRLVGEECSSSGKDFQQTWKFIRVRNNQFLMQQISSGKCLRADSTRNGVFASLERCNSWDNMQVWRVCTSK